MNAWVAGYVACFADSADVLLRQVQRLHWRPSLQYCLCCCPCGGCNGGLFHSVHHRCSDARLRSSLKGLFQKTLRSFWSHTDRVKIDRVVLVLGITSRSRQTAYLPWRQFDDFAIATDIKRKPKACMFCYDPLDSFLKPQFGALLQRQTENTLRSSSCCRHSA